MNPLVSVIVPVYNVCPFLHEALDSVTGQTHKNLEIILIDDGSTDGSGDICDEYKERDKRVIVIHQENKGLSAARNAGLDSANGELIAFLDPDDAFHNEFIEKALFALTNENADIVMCRYYISHTTGRLDDLSYEDTMPLFEPGKYDRKTVLDALIHKKINVSIWNKLYKRHLWDSVRFFEGHVFEDTEVTYKICSRIDKFCAMPASLYHHRKHPDSITSVNSRINLEDAVQSYIRTEPFIRANVPDLFSSDQLLLFERSIIKRMLQVYIKSRHITGNARREFRANLRKQIAESGVKYGVERFGFKMRTAYMMVCRCPWMFDLCYPVFIFFRRAYKKIARCF